MAVLGLSPGEPGDRGVAARVTAAVLAVTVLVVVLATASAALALHAAGGRWFVVTTSSMGRAAPVGTLVVTRPVQTVHLAVGDVISFRPPSVPDEVYTHRVAATTPTGILTSGDTTGTIDPWTVGDDDLVGRAVVLLPVAGWVLHALPWVAGGALVIWSVGARISSVSRRASFRLLGVCLLLAAAAGVLRPFVGVDLLSTTVSRSGEGQAHVVSTGLAPIRVQADGGGHADLSSGMVGHVPLGRAAGTVDLTATLHLPVVGWVVVAFVCALPMLWVLVVGLPVDTDARALDAEEP